MLGCIDTSRIKHCLPALLIVYLLLSTWVNTAYGAADILPLQGSKQTRISAQFPPKKMPMPVYHLQLQVHLEQSSRKARDFIAIFKEINEIWRSQAGICFDIHAVMHGEALDDGLDMWFSPDIGGFNGYYDGDEIQMTDRPVLMAAPHPARFPAGRTAAHELGHALGLHHRQDSYDNLMRSKTRGWQLNPEEIALARQTAAALSSEETLEPSCREPKFNQ